MFDRFTERGLRALALAQQEARRLSHDHAGTEHILLGLLRERDGLAAETLRELGINLHAVREQVEDILGRGRSEPPEHIPYTPRARRVLDLAQREAMQMGHGRVGTEHLLLGLLREGRNVAAQVIVTLGGDLSRSASRYSRCGPTPTTAPPDAQCPAGSPTGRSSAGDSKRNPHMSTATPPAAMASASAPLATFCRSSWCAAPACTPVFRSQ